MMEWPEHILDHYFIRYINLRRSRESQNQCKLAVLGMTKDICSCESQSSSVDKVKPDLDRFWFSRLDPRC